MPTARTTSKARRSAPQEEDLPSAASALRYIESSALVAAIVERDAEAAAQISEIGPRATSALTLAEAARAVTRARVTGRLTPREERSALRVLRHFAQRSVAIAITGEILERSARPFPIEPVRTLDAIHLATLESLGETPQLVTVVTRDDRIARNARALGYAVV
jgi:predicted nucleic acid-binding protein